MNDCLSPEIRLWNFAIELTKEKSVEDEHGNEKERGNKIRMKYTLIVNNLTCLGDITARMYQEKKLNQKEFQDIKQFDSTTIRANEELLNIIIKKPEDVQENFINLLKETDQTHLYQLLVFPDDKKLDQLSYNQDAIRLNFTWLLDHLDSENGLIERLFQSQVLTSHERESFEKKNRYQRNESLLLLLGKKKQEDFEKFLDALSETNQPHVAKKLREPKGAGCEQKGSAKLSFRKISKKPPPKVPVKSKPGATNMPSNKSLEPPVKKMNYARKVQTWCCRFRDRPQTEFSVKVMSLHSKSSNSSDILKACFQNVLRESFHMKTELRIKENSRVEEQDVQQANETSKQMSAVAKLLRKSSRVGHLKPDNKEPVILSAPKKRTQVKMFPTEGKENTEDSEDLKEKVKTLEVEIERLKKEKETLQKENQRATEKVNQLSSSEEKKTQQGTEIGKLKKEFPKRNENAFDAEKQLKMLEEKKMKQEEEIERLKKENETLQKENQRAAGMEKQLAVLEEKNEKQEAEMVMLKKKNETLQNTVDIQLPLSEEKKTKQDAEIEKLKMEKDIMEKENQRAVGLEKQLRMLEEKNEKHEAEIESLETKNKALQIENQRATDAMKQLPLPEEKKITQEPKSQGFFSLPKMKERYKKEKFASKPETKDESKENEQEPRIIKEKGNPPPIPKKDHETLRKGNQRDIGVSKPLPVDTKTGVSDESSNAEETLNTSLKEKLTLTNNHQFLMENIKSAPLVDLLHSKRCITDEQRNRINRQPTNFYRNGELIQWMKTQALQQRSVWKTVLECFREIGQKVIADILEKGSVAVKSKVSCTVEPKPGNIQDFKYRKILQEKEDLVIKKLNQSQRLSVEEFGKEIRIVPNCHRDTDCIIVWFLCESQIALQRLQGFFASGQLVERIMRTIFKDLSMESPSPSASAQSTLQSQTMSIFSEEFRRLTEIVEYEDTPKLLDKRKTQATEKKNSGILGLTILKEELFVINLKSPEIEVYNKVNLDFQRSFVVEHLEEPMDIVSCPKNMRLYIVKGNSSGRPWSILVVDSRGKFLKNLWNKENWFRLAVTKESNIILSLEQKQRLLEISPDGQVLQDVHLSQIGLSSLKHAIPVESNNFLVASGDKSGLYIIDSKGIIVTTSDSFYNELAENNLILIDVIVDKAGSVFVLDMNESRIVLLTSTLDYRRELLNKANGLNCPRRMFFDESTGCLYVADNGVLGETGYIIAYNVRATAVR